MSGSREKCGNPSNNKIAPFPDWSPSFLILGLSKMKNHLHIVVFFCRQTLRKSQVKTQREGVSEEELVSRFFVVYLFISLASFGGSW